MTIAVGTVRVVVVLSPSRPLALLPQQAVVPSVATAHAWMLPTVAVAMALPANGVPTMVGEVGTSRWVTVPSPSWLLVFKPQQASTPSVVTAQVELPPALMLATCLPANTVPAVTTRHGRRALSRRVVAESAVPVVAPAHRDPDRGGGTGVQAAGRDAVDRAAGECGADRDRGGHLDVRGRRGWLLPSRPLVCRPQQAVVPSVATAQVCAVPALTEAMSLPANGVPVVVTAVGTSFCTMVLSPSWPLVLLPQQATMPSVVTAQVCDPPALIWAICLSGQRGGGRDDRGGQAARDGRVRAELAVGVQPPARNGAVGGEGARMVGAAWRWW